MKTKGINRENKYHRSTGPEVKREAKIEKEEESESSEVQ